MKLVKLQELAIKPAKIDRAIVSSSNVDALVGFEVELYVPSDSAFYDEPPSEQELKKISSPEELESVLEDSQATEKKLKTLSRHYSNWVGERIEEWVDENWRDFDDGDQEEARADAEHHIPESEYSFQAWIKQEFNSLGEMLDHYGLVFKVSGTGQEVLDNIRDEISRFLKVKFVMHGDASGSTWAITNDDSVKDDEGNETDSGEHGFNVEIISPPLSPVDALSYLQKVFRFANTYRLRANQSTGLHINISFPKEMMSKLDVVKLALFSGDDYQLRRFGRELSRYAWSQKKYLEKEFSEADLSTLASSASMQAAAKKIMDRTGKYFSFNLNKLQYGYLEFRTAGGVDYINRFSDIRDTVGRYLHAMKISMDPAAARKEYLKKLGALVLKAKSEK